MEPAYVRRVCDDRRMTQPGPGTRRRFGPNPVTLLPVVVLLLGSLPLAASSPWLTPLLLPVLCAVWVLRARVVVAPAGLEVCNGLGVTRVAWADVEGFTASGRGPVRLLRRGADPLPLTALPRHRLRRLTELASVVGAPADEAPPA